uniref:Uncharacterized protein MANES_01G102000 n=1 Tax=Rhizophora mucronata TaxID=61149 RepID=A0A2P2P969_RHIMU
MLKGSIAVFLILIVSAISKPTPVNGHANSSFSCNATGDECNEIAVDTQGCPIPSPSPPSPSPSPLRGELSTYIGYRSLEKQPFCYSLIYGSCLRRYSNKPRSCTYYNRCRVG